MVELCLWLAATLAWCAMAGLTVSLLFYLDRLDGVVGRPSQETRELAAVFCMFFWPVMLLLGLTAFLAKRLRVLGLLLSWPWRRVYGACSRLGERRD